jgi:hypothetical protein
VPVYRYISISLNPNDLSRKVPGATSLGETGSAAVVDVSAPSGSKEDLDEYMLSEGFAYLSTDTLTTPAQDAASVQTANARRLLDFIDAPAEGWPSGMYREVIMGPVAPSAIVWWTNNSPSKLKVVEITYTRNVANCATQVQYKMYATDGTTILSTITDTIAYSGVLETSRTRVIA